MHVLAFLLAVAAILVLVLAALGRDYPRPRLVPLGLALAVTAWVVQVSFFTNDTIVFFD